MKKPDNCPLFEKTGTHERVVAVDFDDTLFHNHFPSVGPVMPGAIRRMDTLRSMGFYIVIFSSRICEHYREIREEQVELIEMTLNKNGIPFDEIWTKQGKPLACFYVDDKAYKSLGGLMSHLDWKEKTSDGKNIAEG